MTDEFFASRGKTGLYFHAIKIELPDAMAAQILTEKYREHVATPYEWWWMRLRAVCGRTLLVHVATYGKGDHGGREWERTLTIDRCAQCHEVMSRIPVHEGGHPIERWTPEERRERIRRLSEQWRRVKARMNGLA